MQYSLSTLNWMSFRQPQAKGEPALPYASEDLPTVIEATANAGFTGIGLDTVVAGGWLEAQKLVSLQQLLVNFGLTCTDLGVIRVSTEKGPEEARRLVPALRTLEVPVCSIVLEENPLEVGMRTLEETVAIIADAGAKVGIEHFAFGAMSSLEQTSEVCEKLGWDRAGLLLDSWHLFHSDEPWDLIESLTADQVALIQVSEGARRALNADDFFRLSRWGRKAPGDGPLDFSQFLAAVAHTGFDGVISPEVLGGSEEFESAHTYAEHLMRSLVALSPLLAAGE